MKTKKKALLMTACAILLVVATVFGTMAYLTAKSNQVRNTFTATNKIQITLDETSASRSEPDPDSTDRVDHNEYNNIIPGTRYVKDPQVNVKGENSYVAIEVVIPDPSDFKAMFGAEANEAGFDLIDALFKGNGYNANWTKGETKNNADGSMSAIFYYSEVVNKDTHSTAPFSYINFPATATDKQIEALDEIIFNAAAVQAENLTAATAQPELNGLFPAHTGTAAEG